MYSNKNREEKILLGLCNLLLHNARQNKESVVVPAALRSRMSKGAMELLGAHRLDDRRIACTKVVGFGPQEIAEAIISVEQARQECKTAERAILYWKQKEAEKAKEASAPVSVPAVPAPAPIPAPAVEAPVEASMVILPGSVFKTGGRNHYRVLSERFDLGAYQRADRKDKQRMINSAVSSRSIEKVEDMPQQLLFDEAC